MTAENFRSGEGDSELSAEANEFHVNPREAAQKRFFEITRPIGNHKQLNAVRERRRGRKAKHGGGVIVLASLRQTETVDKDVPLSTQAQPERDRKTGDSDPIALKAAAQGFNSTRFQVRACS